ncbi:MAG TPA: hypothetical protein VHB72_02165 [Candidatus Saccharimonadales bacterium]|nr:hypothetical protein [Candidatus Saccharimonadales bacterium]
MSSPDKSPSIAPETPVDEPAMGNGAAQEEIQSPESSLYPSSYADLIAEPPEAFSSSPAEGETPTEATQADPAEQTEGHRGWFTRENILKASAAAFVGSVALTLGTNPLSGVEKEVIDAAPWVIGGGAVTEGMWIGGAGLMAGATGKSIGNPFKLHSRWGEITQELASSNTFKAGLAINTLGALGTAGVVAAGAVTSLPPETWPGAVGLAAADMAGTAAIRGGIYAGLKGAETEKKPEVKVRTATDEDLDRLADIDLLLFDRAYGTEKPDKQEVVDMLRQRLHNNPGWMFVSEVDGVVEGFVSAFPTDKPLEEFTSWEDSTANGTLEGRVKPHGKYGYVTNMTIKHEAVELGAEDMLLANLFAKGIENGMEYGYFVARMPHLKRWVESQGVAPTSENKQELAEQYMELKREDGKRYDPQLRMYEGYGFKPQRMVADAFEDDASLDFGVVFRANVPLPAPLRKIKPVRKLAAFALRQLAKKPKLLQKLV